jgi:protein-S-isoprenylcysteine O-methyltransferase Ste14
MALVLVCVVVPPDWPDAVSGPLFALSFPVAGAGIALAVAAFRTLGPAMTPFPVPRAGAELREQGPYRIVRHPMYAGGLLFFAGLGLATSIPALGATLALGVLWWFKAAREEVLLARTYAGYAAYRARVRRRLLPWLL